MKSLSIQLITIMSVIFMVATEAQAARRDVRQGAQRARIHEGVENGSLTRGEAARARAGQRHVRRMERRAEADGNVTAAEKAKIEHAQDRESRKIHRMKHNDKNRVDTPAAPAAPAAEAPAAPAQESTGTTN